MRKGFGIFCILLGVCCLVAAVGLIARNRWEAEHARSASGEILQQVRQRMPVTTPEAEEDPSEPPGELPPEIPAPRELEGDCIGILSIPVLELELPVLTDWSYEKLKTAPCRYYGTCGEKDFVIAAHNYPTHFGNLSALQPGDLILFTDLSGRSYGYEVVLLETLPGNATEEMITSGFDLSLYTCTPGGASRVTVRCSAINR